MNSPDNTGKEILQVISKASKFNQWMYETIRPYTKGNILETGSGLGNISAFFVADGANITLSDTEKIYIDFLKLTFSKGSQIKEILQIDLQHPSFETEYSSLKNRYDSIILINVLEHLPDDEAAIRNCHFLLRQKGTMVILTPAYSFLYSRLDKALGHCRRYTYLNLRLLVNSNCFYVSKGFYFNALGIIAWLYGKFIGLKTIPANKMNMFNKLTPLARLIDNLAFNRIGLSVIIVGEKK
ncbi:MAG TPA: methyltransferase domain-containing protein [Chitinophagaceae bacterium]